MDTNQDCPSTRRPPLVGLGVVILLSIVPFLVGCDLVARAVDEKYEERVHANELFGQFDADCPQRVNSYTTLTGVTNSLGDICFTYRVSESGRTEEFFESHSLMKNLMVKRFLEGETADLIVDLDLNVRHVFQDTDGLQVMSFSTRAKDIKRGRKINLVSMNPQSVRFPIDPFADVLASEIEKLETKTSPRRVKALFESLNALCPVQIDEQVVLEKIRSIGKYRYQYIYCVEEEAISRVNLNFKSEIKRATAEQMNNTEVGDAILRWDLGVSHIYEARDGTRLLSYPTNRNELMRVRLPDFRIDQDDDGLELIGEDGRVDA